jgi:xylulokinase
VSQRIVAGVDCSTQSTKVLLVDADRGEVLASGRAPHLVSGRDGVSETDPAVWWAALASALDATGRAGEVAAISVAGQQHGLVVSDLGGRPLRAAVLWNDTRSAPDAEALVGDLGPTWWASEVGSVPVASFTVTSWAWLRRTEPDVARAVASICLPHDWLTGQLCGRVVTDRGDASGTGWWSVPHGRYHPEVLDHPLVGVDPSWLPPVLGPTEAAGTVTAEAGERTGLRAGTLVGPGTGDNMGAALGLALDPGSAVLSLGTSGTAFAVTEAPAADPTGVVAGFADATGRFLPLACTLNATLAVDRFAAWLGLDRDDIAPTSGTAVVVPFLDGERTPDLPHATGSVLGLTHASTRQEILRSAYEGAVVSLLDALDGIEGPGAAERPLVLVGGGARGRAWREVVGRLSGRPLELPRTEEAVALGAAVQAAACLTGEPLADVARRFGGGHGRRIPAVDPDLEALARHRAVRPRRG